jgi:hypothetical protein
LAIFGKAGLLRCSIRTLERSERAAPADEFTGEVGLTVSPHSLGGLAVRLRLYPRPVQRLGKFPEFAPFARAISKPAYAWEEYDDYLYLSSKIARNERAIGIGNRVYHRRGGLRVLGCSVNHGPVFFIIAGRRITV